MTDNSLVYIFNNIQFYLYQASCAKPLKSEVKIEIGHCSKKNSKVLFLF